MADISAIRAAQAEADRWVEAVEAEAARYHESACSYRRRLDDLIVGLSQPPDKVVEAVATELHRCQCSASETCPLPPDGTDRNVSRAVIAALAKAVLDD